MINQHADIVSANQASYVDALSSVEIVPGHFLCRRPRSNARMWP